MKKQIYFAVALLTLVCGGRFTTQAFAQLALEVTVDTGFTEIVNAGPSSVVFDGYSVASPAGHLGGDWFSLSSRVDNWQVAGTSTAQRRTELNPTSSTTVSPASGFSLGELFEPIAGASPDLTFEYTVPNEGTTFGDVSVLTALKLRVDRGDGSTEIVNTTGGPIRMDGYTIGSPTGALSLDRLRGLSRTGAGSGWDLADNSDANRITELSPRGFELFNGGDEESLGFPYQPPAPSAIGIEVPEDLTFTYTSPNGNILNGDVEYVGPLNNVVLSVDPSTGRGSIQNQSPFFDLSMDAYTITSGDGKLNVDGWNSLQDQGVEGWDEADNVDAFRLTELNPTASTLLGGGGQVLDLGELFDPTDLSLDDISFEYLDIDGGVAQGLVVFGETSGCVPHAGFLLGDFEPSGDVGFADFLILSSNFGQQVASYSEGDVDCSGTVDFADFLILSSNFGQPAGAAVVPEPATNVVFGIAVFGLLVARRRR